MDLVSGVSAAHRPLRVGIDARFLTHPQPGGFKTYTTSLIEALARVDRVNHYSLYVDRPICPSLAVEFGPNITVVEVPEIVPVIGMVWREQVSLVRRAVRDRLDVFHSPTLSAPLSMPCPLIVTVHDMLWRGHETSLTHNALTWRRRAMHAYYRSVPTRAVRRASAVITVSEASKSAIVEQLHLDPSRVWVTLEAAGSHFAPVHDAARVAEVRRRRGLSSDYVLALGSADPRKNLSTLLRAYRGLSPELRQRFTLAVVMAHPRLAQTLHRQVEALGMNDRVVFLDAVDDDELAALYTGATAFVFPSLLEGFGLPLLEAMSCGAPVVAADNSSIPEVTGEAGVLFDGLSDAALTDALTRVLSDDVFRETLIRRGFARAAEFSWDTCARQTVSCYERIARPEPADCA